MNKTILSFASALFLTAGLGLSPSVLGAGERGHLDPCVYTADCMDHLLCSVRGFCELPRGEFKSDFEQDGVDDFYDNCRSV
ncbi:MAG: hypothetical protein ACPHM1_04150, partial [Arenicellales bacterium]